MRLPVMPMERLDLFGAVLFDVRRTSPALQTPLLLAIIGLDLGQRDKLGIDSPREFIGIKRHRGSLTCGRERLGHETLPSVRLIIQRSVRSLGSSMSETPVRV